MTNWEKIVSGKDLVKAKNLRKNQYVEARERRVALSELEEEGWEYVKDYADPKFIKVRKENRMMNVLKIKYGYCLLKWVLRI